MSIKKFQIKDKLCFQLLVNCGYATKEQMLQIRGMSEKRIKGYLSDGYILKEVSNISDVVAYKLTDRGLVFAAKEFGFKNCYFATSIPHDVKLSDFYLSLSPTERATFRNKTLLNADFYKQMENYKKKLYKGSLGYEELRKMYNEGQLLRVDCAYVSDSGENIGYAVLRKNDKQAKSLKAFCEFMNYKYVQAEEIVPSENNQKVEIKGIIKKVNKNIVKNRVAMYKFNVVDGTSTYRCYVFSDIHKDKDFVKLITKDNKVRVIGKIQEDEWGKQIRVTQMELDSSYVDVEDLSNVKTLWVDGREKDLAPLLAIIRANKGTVKVNVQINDKKVISSVQDLDLNITTYMMIKELYNIKIF